MQPRQSDPGPIDFEAPGHSLPLAGLVGEDDNFSSNMMTWWCLGTSKGVDSSGEWLFRRSGARSVCPQHPGSS